MGVMVGRADELAQVRAALTAARGGRGRLVLIVGVAGTGKSRLADAVADIAVEQGFDLARAYCVDDAGAPPLWPWRRLVRGWPGAGEFPGAQLGESDATARFRLFVAFTDLVQMQAGPAGLLIVLEDLHWADRMSVLLLRHLLSELAAVPVVVVATYRESVPGPFADELPGMVGSPVALFVPLAGLGAADVAAWLSELIGPTGSGFAQAMYERTAGNPLLIRLVAEDMVRSGTPTVPDSIERVMLERPRLREIVAARVGPLRPDVRELIEAASVLGERIEATLLTRMIGRDPDGDRLGRAVAAGILRAGSGLAFEHALVRDAVYEAIAPGRRADLHRRAALALASLDGAAGPIAGHWQRSAGADAITQCLRWSEIADEQARAACAHEDAARFAALAVDCARSTHADTAELARLLIRLAEAKLLAGFVEASVAACVEAAELAADAERVDLMARAALVVQGMGHPVVHQVIPPICARALRLLAPDEHATRARLMAQIAVDVAETEGGARPAGLALEALTEAELSADPAAILEAVAARHFSITVPDQVRERLELGRRAIELGAEMEQPMPALWGHLWRADAAAQLGNMTELDHELAAIDQVARKRGSAIARWHHHRYLAARSALAGDFAQARAADAAASELAERVGDPSLVGMSHAFRGELARVRGDLRDLSPDWELALAAAPPMVLVRIGFPINHAIDGQVDLARAEFEEFRHLPRTLPIGMRWALNLAQIGIAAVLLADAEVAATVYDKLLPDQHYYSGEGSGGVFLHGANARLLGDLARTAGRYDEALARYAEAETMNSRIGARPFTALSRLGWAQTLIARAAGGQLPDRDRSKARELVTSAAAEFRRLDMPGPLREAADLIASAEAVQRDASPLSRREAEVAALVADALSNREIAGRLVLSERTVETHVRSILAKLGFATRTEIATWVLRHGSPAR